MYVIRFRSESLISAVEWLEDEDGDVMAFRFPDGELSQVQPFGPNDVDGVLEDKLTQTSDLL